MRRLGAIASLLVLAAIAAAVAGAPARSADTYRVDAVFDTAKGVIPGQLVKIAGARVGTISDVQLTPEYKARVVMEVPKRFSFRADASCSIQPEGLISEHFVQCDPGDPRQPPLHGADGRAPTVPVERTTVPVGLTDLFRIFQADVRQRFTVALAAVGGGLAARGEDLDAVLVRANPTLAAIRRLTRELARQREQLRAAVRDTDRVVTVLARRSGAVERFVEQAERVSARTASRSGELAETIRRLPPLLDAADGALVRLDRLAVESRPLLGRLRAAAPGLERVLAEAGPFADAAEPALRRLSRTADTGRRAARGAAPVVRLLRRFTASAVPVGGLLAPTLVSLRDAGFVENLSTFLYHGAAGLARFDETSHIFPAEPIFSTCSFYAEKPVAGCNAFYGPERAQERRGSARRGPGRTARPVPAATPAPSAQPVPARPKRPRLPGLPQLPEVLAPVEELTGKLVEGLQGVLGGPARDRRPTPDRQALEGLADFLLGR